MQNDLTFRFRNYCLQINDPAVSDANLLEESPVAVSSTGTFFRVLQLAFRKNRCAFAAAFFQKHHQTLPADAFPKKWVQDLILDALKTTSEPMLAFVFGNLLKHLAATSTTDIRDDVTKIVNNCRLIFASLKPEIVGPFFTQLAPWIDQSNFNLRESGFNDFLRTLCIQRHKDAMQQCIDTFIQPLRLHEGLAQSFFSDMSSHYQQAVRISPVTETLLACLCTSREAYQRIQSSKLVPEPLRKAAEAHRIGPFFCEAERLGYAEVESLCDQERAVVIKIQVKNCELIFPKAKNSAQHTLRESFQQQIQVAIQKEYLAFIEEVRNRFNASIADRFDKLRKEIASNPGMQFALDAKLLHSMEDLEKLLQQTSNAQSTKRDRRL